MFARANRLPSWPALDGTEGALVMYAIYAFPIDFPGSWVVRRLFILPGGEERRDVVPHLATDLESARALVPPCLHRQDRSEGDEPHIVEVWF